MKLLRVTASYQSSPMRYLPWIQWENHASYGLLSIFLTVNMIVVQSRANCLSLSRGNVIPHIRQLYKTSCLCVKKWPETHSFYPRAIRLQEFEQEDITFFTPQRRDNERVTVSRPRRLSCHSFQSTNE